MDLELNGKRAIVTGGSRGIGLAIAHQLAAEGCDVAIVARDGQSLLEVASGVAGHGHRVLPMPGDTTDDAAVRRLVGEVVGELGGVDILVNAAARPGGGATPPPLAELTDDAVRIEFETKVLGYLRCARAVAPHMQAQRWGRIISISGLAARQSGTIVGSVRNAAVVAMTKNLADELGPDGINVTAVHPGATVTERTAGMIAVLARSAGMSEEAAQTQMAANISIGRMVTAAEIASVVAFLASPRSVAITGDTIAAGGGAKGSIYY